MLNQNVLKIMSLVNCLSDKTVNYCYGSLAIIQSGYCLKCMGMNRPAYSRKTYNFEQHYWSVAEEYKFSNTLNSIIFSTDKNVCIDSQGGIVVSNKYNEIVFFPVEEFLTDWKEIEGFKTIPMIIERQKFLAVFKPSWKSEAEESEEEEEWSDNHNTSSLDNNSFDTVKYYDDNDDTNW